MRRVLCAVTVLWLVSAGELQAGGWFDPVDPALSMLFKQGAESWKKYGKPGKDALEQLEKIKPLTPEDEEYDGYHDDPGTPQVPTECAGSDECGPCFEKARENLDEQRFRLAKLRRVYVSTMRMGKSAIAFGDNVSGIHGYSGLYWQAKGRPPIERRMKEFQATCRNKYNEMIADLHAALLQLAACEEEFYGEEDWYNRYGFIYYQFMAERYRPDEY